MAVLDFVLRVAWQPDRRRPAFLDPEFSKKRPAARLQDSPEFCHEPKGAKVEDHVLRQIRTQRQPHASDPIQRFLMLRSVACSIEEFFFGQFHRRHVGHVFVVDDKVDGVVFEGQPFAVGAGADAAPASGLGTGDLQREERLCDVEGNVPDVLLFKGQEFLAHLTGEVSESAAHFHDNAGFGCEPAQLPQLPHEQPAIGQTVERIVRLPEKMRDGSLDHVEVAVVFAAIGQSVVMKVLKVLFSLEPFLS